MIKNKTLRDDFACAALPPSIKLFSNKHGECDLKESVETAYVIADLMMEIRKLNFSAHSDESYFKNTENDYTYETHRQMEVNFYNCVMSNRTGKALWRAFIRTPEEALKHTDKDFLKIKNFGERSLIELKNILQNGGVND